MSFTRSHQRIRTALIVSVICVAAAKAQQPSALHDTLRDPLGALVNTATIELLNAGRIVAITNTNPLGEYSFTLTTTGQYSVRVTAPTLQPTTTRAEYLKSSAPTELNITLATATLTQLMTVTATGTPTPKPDRRHRQHNHLRRVSPHPLGPGPAPAHPRRPNNADRPDQGHHGPLHSWRRVVCVEDHTFRRQT
jgi:hypothetical protein